MGVVDGRRHQHVGLVGGIAEHHALVAGALFVIVGLVPDGLIDLGRLLAERVDHGDGVEVVAARRITVADVADYVARQLVDVHLGARADLARNDHQRALEQGFASDVGLGVLRQHGVKDGVGDLVGHLVGMTSRHRLRGEDRIVAHGQTGLLVQRARIVRYLLVAQTMTPNPHGYSD